MVIAFEIEHFNYSQAHMLDTVIETGVSFNK